MILKLRLPTHGETCAWRLLDKIRKIDYEFVDETPALRKKIEDAGMMYINSYPAVSDSKTTKKVAEVCIVYENGLGEMFYTDDMVFIMNDTGKTCDTINVAQGALL